MWSLLGLCRADQRHSAGHWSSSFTYLLVILSLMHSNPWVGLLPGVGAQQCTGSDGCRCTMDDGSVIDVSSLGNTDGTPRFDKVLGNDLYYYSFNPCHAFTERDCQDAAVCQISNDQASYFNTYASSASWSYDGVSAVVYYESNKDTFRQSWVTYVCDPSADDPQILAYGELGIATYYLQVTSKCACPNGCEASSGGGGGGGALSGGSIVLIVFFSLLVVYVVGRVVFNKTQRQATGMDMVPNASFWGSLPGLVKDGFFFVIGKIRGGKAGYSEV